MIQKFSEWLVESREVEVKTATVTLEFEWTSADQMSKSEAAKVLREEFDRIGLPDGLKIVGKPVLDGWSRRGGAPKYDLPYTAEIEISFTGSKASVRSWANSIQLGDAAVDFD
jgi:hypothetical protein